MVKVVRVLAQIADNFHRNSHTWTPECTSTVYSVYSSDVLGAIFGWLTRRLVRRWFPRVFLILLHRYNTFITEDE